MKGIVKPVFPREVLRYATRPWTKQSDVLAKDIVKNNWMTDSREPLIALSNKEKDIEVREPVGNYRTLLELVSRIAALNPECQLYFRGQTNNYARGKPLISLHPSMWHGDINKTSFASARLRLIECGNRLLDEYRNAYPQEKRFIELLEENPQIRWALLQHYGVCGTPLLDVTRNLQVACSFARKGAIGNVGYVYILGLPYLREAITIDTVEGLSLMSLIGITPSNARRPLNQDGYLLTTSEWWRYALDYSSRDSMSPKNKPDFSQRLLATLAIPTNKAFYENSGLSDFDSEWLCPRQDEFADFLNSIGMKPAYW